MNRGLPFLRLSLDDKKKEEAKKMRVKPNRILVLVLLCTVLLSASVSAAGYVLTVDTDNETYSPGEKVLISGKLVYDVGVFQIPLYRRTIGIQVRTQLGTTVYVDQVRTNRRGKFFSTFRVPLKYDSFDRPTEFTVAAANRRAGYTKTSFTLV